MKRKHLETIIEENEEDDGGELTNHSISKDVSFEIRKMRAKMGYRVFVHREWKDIIVEKQRLRQYKVWSFCRYFGISADSLPI